MQSGRLAVPDKVFGALACVALAGFPATMLSLPAAANGLFAILLAWSLWCLASGGNAARGEWLRLVKTHWPVMLAMAALPLAVAWHDLAGSHRPPDVPYLYLRFGLFVLLAWGLVVLGSQRLKLMQWGLVAGALQSAIWMHFVAAELRPSHVGAANVIPFANLSLLMGMLSLLSIGWSAPRARLEIALKTAGGLAGLYVSYLSGTRGNWIAIPVLALIVIAASRRLGMQAKAGLLTASIGTLAVIGYVSERVNHRIMSALSGLDPSQGAVLDTSVSARLELWRASLDMFLSRPLAGVGIDGFAGALQAMAANGDIAPLTATLAHSHNDLLFAAATLGVPGLLAVFAMYIVPAGFFLLRLRDPDPDVRTACAGGLALCIGFVTFGLTEAMFVIALTNAFYTLVMATCFAIVVARTRKIT